MKKILAIFFLLFVATPAFAGLKAVSGSSGGGGGTPGGTSGQIQYNNAGSFGGLATVPSSYISVPDSTTTTSAAIGSSSMGGQINFNGSSLTATIPAISSTVFASGMTSIIANYNSSVLTLSSTPTINGLASSTILHNNGFYAFTSNGTTLDAVGFPGLGTVTTNALGKFIDASGAETASSITDNGTLITTTEQISGGAFFSPPSVLTISTSTFTPVYVGNSGGSNTYRVVLVHASCPCTIAAPTGTATDGGNFILEIWQSATGSDTVTFNSVYDFGTTGAPTLTTTASKGDILGFHYSAQNSKLDYIGIQQGL